MRVHHEHSFDDFIALRDRNDIVAVAEGRIAFFIEAVRVGQIQLRYLVDGFRAALVVVIAPDRCPRDSVRVDFIRERLVRRHIARPRDVACDGDEIGLFALDEGAHGVLEDRAVAVSFRPFRVSELRIAEIENFEIFSWLLLQCKHGFPSLCHMAHTGESPDAPRISRTRTI